MRPATTTATLLAAIALVAPAYAQPEDAGSAEPSQDEEPSAITAESTYNEVTGEGMWVLGMDAEMLGNVGYIPTFHVACMTKGDPAKAKRCTSLAVVVTVGFDDASSYPRYIAARANNRRWRWRVRAGNVDRSYNRGAINETVMVATKLHQIRRLLRAKKAQLSWGAISIELPKRARKEMLDWINRDGARAIRGTR